MNIIKIAIEEARPNIKQITIKNYLNVIKSISKKATGKEFKNLNFLKNTKKVESVLNEMSFNSRRSTITAIVVGLGAVNEDRLKAFYDNLLMKAQIEYNKKLNNMVKSDKTRENWTTLKALVEIRNEIEKLVLENHIPDKEGLTTKNHKILQTYLIASLYTMIPPRRNIYGTVKLISTVKFKKMDQEEKKANFLVFSKRFKTLYFYLGDQKSDSESKEHAIQRPPKKLREVLKLFLRFNSKREYLLINNRGGILGTQGLGRALLEIFGIGSTMIRKIYISESTKKAHAQIEKIASAMGHSVGMQRASYLKN